MLRLTPMILGLLSMTAHASSEDAPILGGVQFWSRTCATTEKCELPSSIGPVHVVRGSIAPPQQPNEVGHFKQIIEQDGLRLIYQIFWKIPREQKPNFVFQQKLMRRDGENFKALAECSTYTSDELRPVFHAGACTGFVASEDTQQQWGVSFIKAPAN